jgi:hypothetical protein
MHDLIQQFETDFPGEWWQSRVRIFKDGTEAREIPDPLRRDEAELVQVRPQCVDRIGSLLHKLLAGAAQDGARLQVARLKLNIAKDGQQRLLHDRLCVRSVVFCCLMNGLT